MIDTAEDFARSTSRRIRWTLILSFLVAVLGMAIIIFFGIGRWLFVEDNLEKAPAILVLSGRMPLRAIEAARLYNGGYAAGDWATTSTRACCVASDDAHRLSQRRLLQLPSFDARRVASDCHPRPGAAHRRHS